MIQHISLPNVEVDLLEFIGDDIEFGDNVVPEDLEVKFTWSCDLCSDLLLDEILDLLGLFNLLRFDIGTLRPPPSSNDIELLGAITLVPLDLACGFESSSRLVF